MWRFVSSCSFDMFRYVFVRRSIFSCSFRKCTTMLTIFDICLKNIRIKIVSVTAVDNANPWIFNNPVNVPSKTPIPPGTNDATPNIIDVAYVGII